MKMSINLALVTLTVIFLFACSESNSNKSSKSPENDFGSRLVANMVDSLEEGSTYLSVYTKIYSQNESTLHNLTATVSMRNTDMDDTIYVRSANFYDTHGELVKAYLENPIYIAPMETVEIVLNRTSREGGSGANFVFDWSTKEGSSAPIFDGVMISTSGQQGLSFNTIGIRIK